ncbi:MAG TPA: sigma factor [Candidatus Paceibacterota bacterium]|nr:sigma factor [Verrucomicrobiota bacterium]HSA10899.1 sigma factor [Candidatus Paceibacterota bacterium]
MNRTTSPIGDEEWRRLLSRIYKNLRRRLGSDDAAEEVLGIAKCLIMQHLNQFDPAKAPIAAFAFFWADIAVKRYLEDITKDLPTLPLPHTQDSDSDTDGGPSRVPPALQTPPLLRDQEYSKSLLFRICSLPLPPDMILVFLMVEVLGWRQRELVANSQWSVAALFMEAEVELAGILGLEVTRGGLQPLREVIEARKTFAELKMARKTRASYASLLGTVPENCTLEQIFHAKGWCTARAKSQGLTNIIGTVRKRLQAGFRK